TARIETLEQEQRTDARLLASVTHERDTLKNKTGSLQRRESANNDTKSTEKKTLLDRIPRSTTLFSVASCAAGIFASASYMPYWIERTATVHGFSITTNTSMFAYATLGWLFCFLAIVVILVMFNRTDGFRVVGFRWLIELSLFSGLLPIAGSWIILSTVPF